MKLHSLTQETLVSADELSRRIAELGAQITQDYQGKELLLICTLRGASVFFSDLIRHIDLPVTMDFIRASSYGGGTSTSGTVSLLMDVHEPVEGAHVLIVEDIVDSGHTMQFLINYLKGKNPASLSLCTLLDKPSRREVDVTPHYVGFTIPNAFVVGYGLDYDEKFRNLPDVCILKPEVYSK